MQKIFAAAIAALAAVATAHAADTYTIDPSHTFPRFEISHFGFSTHHGQFNKTTGTVVLDRKAGTGSIDITVDTTSVGTGDAKLEEHLRGADFFNVAKFPTMVFKSKALKFDGGTPVQAVGELTLLGVTKPLTLTISRVKCGPHPMAKDKEVCGAEASGKLKRTDFGMKTYVPAVGDEVTLRIQVEALKN
jgi:polyisoprenoid-binding protein YceI